MKTNKTTTGISTGISCTPYVKECIRTILYENPNLCTYDDVLKLLIETYDEKNGCHRKKRLEEQKD